MRVLSRDDYINWLTIYTYVGYAIIQICYFSMCRPFMDFSVVPPRPGQGNLNPLLPWCRPPLTYLPEQCASYLNVLVVQGCFNITSDIGVLPSEFHYSSSSKSQFNKRSVYSLFSVWASSSLWLLYSTKFTLPFPH